MTEDEKEVHRMLMESIEEDAYVDVSEEIDHPPVAISMGEYSINTPNGTRTYPIPLGTYGNFSFIQAPPKSMKTFMLGLLSSVYLGGTTNYTGNMKGNQDGKMLIHFDTEQGRFHAQRVFQRPLRMTEFEAERYKTYGLRKFSHKTRRELIEYVLYENAGKVGYVIIDGIADLLCDVNNIVEANDLAQDLLRWTEETGCHIVTVIHSNFGSHKATGHLGSVLEKKAETQIRLERNDVNPHLITAKCMRSRNRGFEDFSFKVNDKGLPELELDLYDVMEGL